MTPAFTLTYICGCREVFTSGAESREMRSEFPCRPEQCQSCAADPSACTFERTGVLAYRPVEWSELNGGPKRVMRMRLGGAA